MMVRLDLNIFVERSHAAVFRFYAENHVQNHPAGIQTWNSNN